MNNSDYAQTHNRLAAKLHEIELKDTERKALIHTCLLKAFELSLNSKDSQNGKPLKNGKKSKTTEEQSLQIKSGLDYSHEQALKKLNEYQRRVFVLKLELSTKEQAHEAKIDSLNALIDRLQEQANDAQSSQNQLSHKLMVRPHTTPSAHKSQNNTTVRSFLSTQRGPVINNSPFAADLSRGSFLAGSDLAKIASKATLKLSKDTKAPLLGDVLFSPNNSSAESTPVKSIKKFDINLSSSSLLGSSEVEESFQTANGTFGDNTEKKKKRRIRLLSSQASKVPLSDSVRENEDVNSLDYYLDANFEEESSPVRSNKRLLEDSQEPPAKKRHVFKI